MALIGASFLIYRWWARHRELENLKAQIEQKEKEIQQQYQLQNSYPVSTSPLAKSPNIQKFFTDLLKKYVEKFSESKKIDISSRPLIFKGFYLDQKIGKGLGEMGRCSSYFYPHREITISLNQVYLLNKLGNDRFFTSYPQDDYYYLDISFDKMLQTCSHELAHYIQHVKHDKSSCESDLKLERKEYDPILAQEHKEFTQEIYKMIKNSEDYSYWEKRWKEID